MNHPQLTKRPYGVRRRVAAFLSTTRFLSRIESGDTSPHSIMRFAFATVLLATLSAFANDPIVNEGFDENGIKWILFDETNENPIDINMLPIDPTDSGIPNAVKTLAGYPLDVDTDTLLGGIPLFGNAIAGV